MTNKESFLQKVFYQISLEKDPELWQDDVDSKQKNAERIKFLSGFEETRYKVQLDKSKSSNRKNDVLAKALKEKGNKEYSSGDSMGALVLYNQALCYSSQEGEYSTLLGNRSALWAQLGSHRLVVSDIIQALESGYPDKLRYKLYERRSKSYFSLKMYSEALEDVKLALKHLKFSNLEEDKLKSKQSELSKVKLLIERDVKNVNTSPATIEMSGQSVLSLENASSQFPSLSDAVLIKYGSGRGRYAVAGRDIRVGELLAVETAQVAGLDKEERLSHCWQCLRAAQCPLPCLSCSGVMFCSPQCRTEACSTYHQWECGYTDLLHQASLGAWYLAYRALTTRPWHHYRDSSDHWLNHDERAGLEQGQVYRSEDLDSFNNLVTHDGVGKKQAPELMMQCHVVVFLVRLMVTLGYLEHKGNGLELGEEEMLAAQILHHFMRAAYYNTHEITELETVGDNIEDNKVRRIGRVTNPTLALINHSCDPNYRRVSVGTTTYGFACKPIGKGKEICDLYCKPFSVSDLEGRQKYLAKYNFCCECQACVQNWPSLHSLQSSLEDLPLRQYNQNQKQINNQIKRVLRSQENYNKMEKKSGVSDQELVEGIVLVLEELHKLLKSPHQQIVYWENKLHQALLAAHAARVKMTGTRNAKILWPE